jgi:hypothetical protein
MQRKVLVATVATAPLLAMAFGAYAETVISTARTTPIATLSATAAGAADDVKIDAAGSIKLTTAGALVTLNSSNKVVNLGSLATVGVNDSIGVLVLGGNTGAVTNSLTISQTEDYTATDTDSDGDLDGVFAQGSGRYGIRVTGPAVFTGDIIQDSAGSITIEGNNSAGISVETGLVGNLTNNGAITVTGDNSYGVHVTGPVTGNITQGGGTTVLGQNAVGLAVDGNVSGALAIQGSVTASGYRYTSRPAETAVVKLDADDLLQGGPAARISGNVGGGILLNGPSSSTVVSGTTTTTTTISSTATGTGGLTVYGGAPALLIGSDTQAVTIGAVGTADNAYGLISKGAITATGVYDKVAATGVQIGGATGQTTTLTGGMRNDSTITVTSREANATGVELKAGAVAPSIWNRGGVTATSASYAGSGLTGDARALVIDAGASVTNLDNSGGISANRSGETGDAIAVLDTSGTLSTITNTGTITAYVAAPTVKSDGTTVTTATAAGKAIALDLRASTGGVTFTQKTPVSTSVTTTFPASETATTATVTAVTVTPTIIGEVRFGSGADTFNVLAGNVIGDISFGGGADAFNIDGGSVVLGALRDSDGQLAIKVGTGSLGITNAETINATSLTLDAGSKLLFTADPANNANTHLVVSGAVNIASGAQLGLRLASLLTAPTSYTVITGGSLNAGTINQDLLGGTPYLYVATSRTDTNNVYLDVRRRTASEIGMNRTQSLAYDATFAALSKNTALADVFLAQDTKDGLLGMYDQMLPDQGEGIFAAMQSVNQAISSATGYRPDPGDRYGPDSIWMQEINTLIRRDTADTMGSDTQAIGFVGGYEAMGDAGGALGLTLAYVNVEEHDIAAKVGEQTTGDFVQLGGYWRRSIGGWRMNAGGGAGYSWYQGDRVFNSGDLNGDGKADFTASSHAKWTGYTFNAFAGTAYEAKLGRYFVRPEARIDYLYLQEGTRVEKDNCGDCLGQTRLKRKSDSLTGDVGVAFGADFGRELWWRPEVRVGYRQHLAGQIGDTNFHYAGGSPVILPASDQKDNAVTLGFALRAGTPMSYLALEANAEAAKKQKRYNLKLIGRTMF